MSRNTETNARAHSAGDGDSVLSSYENSPRNKISELKTTGPSGDYSTANLITSNIIIYGTNSSTDSEDQECAELKCEYLQRIDQIREKLASIDIANKNYYDSCFTYPPSSITSSQTSRCKITEIVDEETQFNLKNLAVEPKEADVPKALPQSPLDKASDTEFRTILDYSANYKEVSSSEELFDLNYNPPKKRTCLRESTPKIVVSDGAVSLPYHIRVSLDDVITKSRNNQSKIEAVIAMPPNDKPNHIFPEVQIECSERDCLSPKESKFRIERNDAPAPSQQAASQENVYLLFLDTLEQSASVSPKTTNRSRVTEISSTTDSSPPKQKKKRLLLRSASNKVKPTDRISLWEEIRTMEALKKKTRPPSSSSRESGFRHVLLKKKKKERSIDINAIGSLDVPRKSRKATKFPSITKITRMCSSVFRKSSERDEGKECRGSTAESNKKETLYVTPKTANALLDLKRDQEVDLNSEDTPTGEKFSQCSYADEDDLDTYTPFCLFCPCF